MKLILVIAAIFIIGTNAGSPSYSPMTSSLPSVLPPQSCADLASLIQQLSWDIRELLKQQVLLHSRAVDVTGITGGNFLLNILSNILSNNNVLKLENILLNNILNPNVLVPINVTGKNDFGFDINATWGCLTDYFTQNP